MKKKIRRRYIIHRSIQFKYIALSVMPALIAVLYCIYFFVESGNTTLRACVEKSLEPIYATEKSIEKMRKTSSREASLNAMDQLEAEIELLKTALEENYTDTISSWNKTRRKIFLYIFFCLYLVAGLAVIYSHRIAGPLFRLKNCVDTLAEGKDTGVITVRKHDELKDLAASLERLRMLLNEKGVFADKH